MKPGRTLYDQRLMGEIIGAAIEVHRRPGPGLFVVDDFYDPVRWFLRKLGRNRNT